MVIPSTARATKPPKCPQCGTARLRKLSVPEAESGEFDCAVAKVPFNPDTARVCGKCGYLHA
jgi:predicted nucleic-acid-binding Zn-ribbon protein